MSKSNFGLIVLLGAGISYDSGLPGVDKLTEAILNDKWYRYTDRIYAPGDHAADDKLHNDVPHLQAFLRLLKSHADDYLMSRTGRRASYEDLFYLCGQIADDLRHEIDNPALLPFINSISMQANELINSLPKLLIKIDVRYLATRACYFIQCVVENELFTKDQPKGLSLLQHLASASGITKLCIATLNHDTLAERVLQDSGIQYNDGFVERDGDVLFYDPMHFQSESKCALLKLHGSINWYRYRLSQNNQRVERWGIPTNDDYFHPRRADGELFEILDYSPIFLTGTYNKMLNYGYGIFANIHSKFGSALHNHDKMVVSGYGWNDRGINDKLFEWLLSSPNRRLILLHQEPETLKQSQSAMWHRYDDLVKDGRLIPVEKWLSETSIDEIFAIIKDKC